MFNFIPNPFSLSSTIIIFALLLLIATQLEISQHPLQQGRPGDCSLPKTWLEVTCATSTALASISVPFPHLSISKNATWLRQLLSVLLSQQQSLGAEGATEGRQWFLESFPRLICPLNLEAVSCGTHGFSPC